MWCRFIDSGGVYKLAFGPKAFIVVSDPVVVRHLLRVRTQGIQYLGADQTVMNHEWTRPGRKYLGC